MAQTQAKRFGKGKKGRERRVTAKAKSAETGVQTKANTHKSEEKMKFTYL
jgi:hypothetical protein